MSAARQGRPRSGRADATPTLARDELHVWTASLDRPDEVVENLRGLLGSDERERADKFHFDRDRSRYIVGRGLLRLLLGQYLAVAPTTIRFAYGSFDKPALPGSGLWFNVSHSGAVALLGFTRVGEIGLDLELDDAAMGSERIPERFFSPSEVEALRSLAEPLQARAFLTCWTRKEAFVKARGDGLSLPLHSFDVSLTPGQPAAILRTSWSSDEPTEWSISDLSDPEAGYVAAAAIRARGWRVVRRNADELLHEVG